MSKPSHISADGSISMVDVSDKQETHRTALAEASLRFAPAAADALRNATLAKGDAFVTAQVAGILAAKQTGTLIPLAHPLPLAHVEVTFEWAQPTVLRVVAAVATSAQTGVEMEAMVAATVAALTLYDMAKGIDKGIVIETVQLLEKTGGKSGTWKR